MRHAIECVTPFRFFLLTALAFPLAVWVLHHPGPQGRDSSIAV